LTARTLAGLPVAFALEGLPALAGTPAAFAHDALVDTGPAEGETITAEPSAFSLTFSEELLDITGRADGIAIHVQGHDNCHYESACPTLDRTMLTANIALGAPGTYTVKWRAMSNDDHNATDTYHFDYVPVGMVILATSFDSPLTCMNGNAVRAEAVADRRSDGATTVGLIPGGIAIVTLLAATGVFIALRRRRGASASDQGANR